ncbi:zinc finger CCCH domain-containing protein 1-like isoform X2 [Zingiber officinale]|uniref:Uncharacterized protein n=1 Tax=Zingiber officinale TaxID=94328 RepID=A0A8J5KXS7_ZINOF|nr:zinc finger CCCH domain-containing protein 1-like isoform X2 [Zingiber officinale]KAG6500349.1 hypothetical protein ZIOFF_040194 [Zingiber officinale]
MHFTSVPLYTLGRRGNMSNFYNFFRKPKDTKNIRKRKKVDFDEEVSIDDILSFDPKMKKFAELSFSSSCSEVGFLFQFDSSMEIQVKHDSCTMAALEMKTEFSKDACTISEWVLKRAEEALKGK